MSYLLGPNRIMSVMKVPVEVSNFDTPDSTSWIHCWYFGSSSSPTASPRVLL
jgi:hypothetical protein